jgi:hypothetical protein
MNNYYAVSIIKHDDHEFEIVSHPIQAPSMDVAIVRSNDINDTIVAVLEEDEMGDEFYLISTLEESSDFELGDDVEITYKNP